VYCFGVKVCFTYDSGCCFVDVSIVRNTSKGLCYAAEGENKPQNSIFFDDLKGKDTK